MDNAPVPRPGRAPDDLYIMAIDSDPLGLYGLKIGRSQDVKARARSMEVSMPFHLNVLGVFTGYGHLEGRVHELLEPRHNRDGRGREWFRVSLAEAVSAISVVLGLAQDQHGRDSGSSTSSDAGKETSSSSVGDASGSEVRKKGEHISRLADRQKVKCPRCARVVSLKILKYRHKCGRSFDLPVRVVDASAAAAAVFEKRMAACDRPPEAAV